MTERIRPVYRNVPLLLPPDLRDWVPEDDMVHFVIEAVEKAPFKLNDFRVNHRGTGSKQYSPKMMLALLIYCYANGIFSSRRIERATHRDIGVRYLTGNQHPDHDTICRFRRLNGELFAKTFLHVLMLAKECNVLKVGTVSIDGTHIRANASKSKNVRYDRAQDLEEKLREDIADLTRQAEEADNGELDDGQKLPEEISRRERLLEKMKQAQADLERRAAKKHEAEEQKYEKKLAECAERKEQGEKNVRLPQAPKKKEPDAKDQANLTDADSRLMRKNRRSGYEQSYNAQATVDADGSQLVLGQHVSTCASDANELKPALKSVHPSVGKPKRGLADSGYRSSESFKELEDEYDLYVSVGAEDGNNHRRYDYRPPKEKPPPAVTDPRLVAMKEKLKTEEGRKLYAKRKQTVEPVFGIIKSVLGFRQFFLRGLEKVELEWNLVTLAYNVKRLYALTREKSM